MPRLRLEGAQLLHLALRFGSGNGGADLTACSFQQLDWTIDPQHAQPEARARPEPQPEGCALRPPALVEDRNVCHGHDEVMKLINLGEVGVQRAFEVAEQVRKDADASPSRCERFACMQPLPQGSPLSSLDPSGTHAPPGHRLANSPRRKRQPKNTRREEEV